MAKILSQRLHRSHKHYFPTVFFFQSLSKKSSKPSVTFENFDPENYKRVLIEKIFWSFSEQWRNISFNFTF